MQRATLCLRWLPLHAIPEHRLLWRPNTLARQLTQAAEAQDPHELHTRHPHLPQHSQTPQDVRKALQQGDVQRASAMFVGAVEAGLPGRALHSVSFPLVRELLRTRRVRKAGQLYGILLEHNSPSLFLEAARAFVSVDGAMAQEAVRLYCRRWSPLLAPPPRAMVDLLLQAGRIDAAMILVTTLQERNQPLCPHTCAALITYLTSNGDARARDILDSAQRLGYLEPVPGAPSSDLAGHCRVMAAALPLIPNPLRLWEQLLTSLEELLPRPDLGREGPATSAVVVDALRSLPFDMQRDCLWAFANILSSNPDSAGPQLGDKVLEMFAPDIHEGLRWMSVVQAVPNNHTVTTMMDICVENKLPIAQAKATLESIFPQLVLTSFMHAEMIRAASRVGNLSLCEELYFAAQSVWDRLLGNAMLSACAEAGSADRAVAVVKSMVHHEVALHTDTLEVLGRAIKGSSAPSALTVLHLLEQLSPPIVPNTKVGNAILQCVASDPTHPIWPIYQRLQDLGMRPDSLTWATLIDASTTHGFDVALGAFEEVLHAMTPSRTVYARFIQASRDAGEYRMVIWTFHQLMRIGIPVSTAAVWVALFDACKQLGDAESTKLFISQLLSRDPRPANVTLAAATSALATCSLREEGERLIATLRGRVSNSSSGTDSVMAALIRFRRECGDFEAAFDVASASDADLSVNVESREQLLETCRQSLLAESFSHESESGSRSLNLTLTVLRAGAGAYTLTSTDIAKGAEVCALAGNMEALDEVVRLAADAGLTDDTTRAGILRGFSLNRAQGAVATLCSQLVHYQQPHHKVVYKLWEMSTINYS